MRVAYNPQRLNPITCLALFFAADPIKMYETRWIWLERIKKITGNISEIYLRTSKC